MLLNRVRVEGEYFVVPELLSIKHIFRKRLYKHYSFSLHVVLCNVRSSLLYYKFKKIFDHEPLKLFKNAPADDNNSFHKISLRFSKQTP